ncbi:MAG: type II toxin-antitoxin system RelE family toxin [Candidatus Hodarchaeales archaeon]
MDYFQIVIARSAKKEMRKIANKDLPRIIDKIKKLSINPFPSQATKLEGFRNLYRIRSGKYRIIYTVDTNEKFITILHVRHRKDIYQNL